MCGRFTLTATPEALNLLFPSLFDHLDIQPRYNIAPTQNVLAVRHKPDTSEPEAVWLKWGLVPGWADDPKIGYKMINARAETVAAKPSFRSAFKKRRCLILADGYYEWQKLDAKTKQPHWLHLCDQKPFAFAGLWEYWHRDAEPVESCTIITTEANDTTRKVHDRMPLVLSPEQCRAWLDLGADVTSFLQPSPATWWAATPVSTLVNNPRNNKPECISPLVKA